MGNQPKSVGKVITIDDVEKSLLALEAQHQQQVQQANATAGAIQILRQQLAHLKG